MASKEYTERFIGKKVKLTFIPGESPLDKEGIDYSEGIIDYIDIDEDFEDQGYYIAFKDFRAVSIDKIRSIEVIE